MINSSGIRIAPIIHAFIFSNIGKVSFRIIPWIKIIAIESAHVRRNLKRRRLYPNKSVNSRPVHSIAGPSALGCSESLVLIQIRVDTIAITQAAYLTMSGGGVTTG
jgi:hypothetical protein